MVCNSIETESIDRALLSVDIRTPYPEMIVIIVSAYDDEKTVVYAMGLGAYDYLVKSLDLDVLIGIVRKGLWTTTK